MSDIANHSVHLPDRLLEEIKIKLQYARLDEGMAEVEWNDLEIGHANFKRLVEYWRDEYDWRKFEAYVNNSFHHFLTPLPVSGFEDINLHFLHHRSSRPGAIPLIFVHGWPGSFLEACKIILFSYTKKSGFGLEQHAECLARLMKKLGYHQYVCQGGDWGSSIVRYMALNHSNAVRAIHINMLLALPPDEHKSPEKYARYSRNEYSEQEICNLERTHWFSTEERGYQRIQETKPVTLGYALHDSPVAILAWFVGKLSAWTDEYPWTPDELIHWSLIHYQGSPSAAMQIYKEASAVLNASPDSMLGQYICQPVGASVFPKELWVAPRDWVEEACNVQFWRHHRRGGHFAAWECPQALVDDVAEFYREDGPVFGGRRKSPIT
ncbi:epoxide hydrolase [Aspergillus brunneoviolaceus CBS 621.78]|uniref:Alpha/beta-hydrolase n=1 Tax=Aspergillus brunneoviolaceus CBS 621.78 TaxID=1450534 RepID=A0ACD1GBJ6_9EURO|nr:alpha/beta-hydrolase [Aspergillus brunneoviolaceus CBS 621.78]RAH46628.1 alpha/beta-hydrolase [Aspergillus brunneoviolaceus CBS 621.78]